MAGINITKARIPKEYIHKIQSELQAQLLEMNFHIEIHEAKLSKDFDISSLQAEIHSRFAGSDGICIPVNIDYLNQQIISGIVTAEQWLDDKSGLHIAINDTLLISNIQTAIQTAFSTANVEAIGINGLFNNIDLSNAFGNIELPKNFMDQLTAAIASLNDAQKIPEDLSAGINVNLAEQIEELSRQNQLLDEQKNLAKQLKDIYIQLYKTRSGIDQASPAYAQISGELDVAFDNIRTGLHEAGASEEYIDTVQKSAKAEADKIATTEKAKSAQKQYNEEIAEANRLLREYEKAKKAELSFVGGDTDSVSYKRATAKSNKAQQDFEDYIQDGSRVFHEDTKVVEDFGKALNKVNEEFADQSANKQAKIIDNIVSDMEKAELAKIKIQKRADALTHYSTFDIFKDSEDHATYLTKVNETLTKLDSMRTIIEDTSGTDSDIEARRVQLIGLNKEYEQLLDYLVTYEALRQAENADYLKESRERKDLDQVGADTVKYLNNYESKLKKLPALYQRIIELQSKINTGEINSSFARDELHRIRMEARSAGVEVDTLWDKLKRRFAGEFRGYIAGMGLGYLSSTLREVYQNVLQLDTAMTELKKVTNATENDYINFLYNAETRAKKLGATLVDTVSATADMARLGYSIEDASNLADVALIYKNVGDGIENIENASSNIISTMQGFGIAADEAMEIVDRFNEVANNYASTAGDIGNITKRSASAMQVAGSTLDETIALGVTANEVVQDAEQVGNGLKTLSMRLRSTKSDMEAAGEDTSGMADSVSKLRDEILALTGVDLQIDEDTYKTPYQILTEIGKVWDDLSDMERANVGEKLFGKQRANIGFAILENYERAEAILKTSQESAGSAFRENEIYLESIQGRLDKLAASWQSLSNNLLDSDTVKSAVSGANAVLDIVNAIVENLGLMPGLIAAAGTVWAQHNHVGKECALLLRAA